MGVEIRDNFNWERRPLFSDDSIIINRYSALMVLVLCRACDIAERHSHHVVRVEHFIEALLAEPDARMRLSELGYADNPEVRGHRFQLLSRPMFTAGEVPADALGYSDGLKIWHRAAQDVAERREPELRTIIVDDFVAAVQEDLVLHAAEPEALQKVLARYKQLPTESFRSESRRRFDQVDQNIRDAQVNINWDINTVGEKVEGVGRQVTGVSHQVADVKSDTTAILAQTNAVYARLPAEMRVSAFLMMMVMLTATVGGACVGLLTRWHWGGV